MAAARVLALSALTGFVFLACGSRSNIDVLFDSDGSPLGGGGSAPTGGSGNRPSGGSAVGGFGAVDPGGSSFGGFFFAGAAGMPTGGFGVGGLPTGGRGGTSSVGGFGGRGGTGTVGGGGSVGVAGSSGRGGTAGLGGSGGRGGTAGSAGSGGRGGSAGSGGFAGTPPGSCCVEHNSRGCSNRRIEACVCAADDYCCTDAWDELCVTSVELSGCGSCGGSAGAGGASTIDVLCDAPADACSRCLCASCSDTLVACWDDPSCLAILACTERTNCQGLGCYTPNTCRGPIDASGGLVSTSMQRLAALIGCSGNAGCPCN